jgi:hypothetical protein
VSAEKLAEWQLFRGNNEHRQHWERFATSALGGVLADTGVTNMDDAAEIAALAADHMVQEWWRRQSPEEEPK